MVYTTKYSKNAPKTVKKFSKGGKVPGTNIPASRIYDKNQLKQLEEQRGREEYDREGMSRLVKEAADEE